MEAVTFVIAVWGAIVSSLLAVIRFIEFRQNRASIKVKITIAYPVYGGNVSKSAQLCLTAINKGRQKTQLEAAGLRLSDNSNIPFISDIFGNRFPKELEGKDSYSVFFNISGIREALKNHPSVSTTYGWFREKIGNLHACSIPPKIKKELHN